MDGASGFSDILLSSAARAPWGWAMLAGGIYAYLRVWPKVKMIGNAAVKQSDDQENARWDRLMLLNDSLTKRIDALEHTIAEQTRRYIDDMATERRRCDDEIAELRKDHATEVGEIRRELAGVYRMINAQGSANARLFEPRDDLPEDIKEKLRNLEQGRKLNREGNA